MPEAANNKVWDYKGFFGQNFTQDGEAGEVFDKPPKDPKDYAIYRQYHEDQMMMVTQGFGRFYVTMNCWDVQPNGKVIQLKKPKPGHEGAAIAISCPHVLIHDPVNPEDVYFTPYKRELSSLGYYLCKTCFFLLEKKKLDLGDATGPKCGKCIEEAVFKLMTKDPGKYHDLRMIGRNIH